MPTPLVYVVDDDEGMLDSVAWLLASVELECSCFQDGAAFLEAFDPERPSCVILDVRMPTMDGFELFDLIRKRRIIVPIIFVTANANVPMAVKAMQHGSFNFIEKPYVPQDLLDLISQALAKSETDLQQRKQKLDFLNRFQLLSNRELEVLREVVKGKQSKIIAHDLGISCKTVDAHRSSIREKFNSTSVAELVNEVLTHKREWCEEL
ncbi:response regulator transcription factor [Kineobactrum salinum]|uniref:Response regulator transcription factor n=1 Tax=Kineobactrum salinum TaxID=2708301 RepID=A0A6C0TX58_9GAMM|nr:response regulator [Kineobactrum salinum]QIB64103.1 response regulator transcription factor [Kineobactrum salinum]